MVTASSAPGPIALVGSGEFLPQMIEVDRALLEGRPPRVAILPTAAGQEGPGSIERWLALGRDHYRAMDVEPVEVPVVTRADADDAELAARIADVGLVYLSGGNPGYLAETLRGTIVWAAIEAAWSQGASLAGCSAGAMTLSAHAPMVRGRSFESQPGIGVVGHLSVIPHFDRMRAWSADAAEQRVAESGDDVTVVGIDEDTALVGGPHRWTVMGRQQVTVFGTDGPVAHGAGAIIELHPS